MGLFLDLKTTTLDLAAVSTCKRHSLFCDLNELCELKCGHKYINRPIWSGNTQPLLRKPEVHAGTYEITAIYYVLNRTVPRS